MVPALQSKPKPAGLRRARARRRVPRSSPPSQVGCAPVIPARHLPRQLGFSTSDCDGPSAEEVPGRSPPTRPGAAPRAALRALAPSAGRPAPSRTPQTGQGGAGQGDVTREQEMSRASRVAPAAGTRDNGGK